MILEEEMVVARLLRGTVLPGRSLFGRAGFARKCGEIDVLLRSRLRLRGERQKQTVGITGEIEDSNAASDTLCAITRKAEIAVEGTHNFWAGILDDGRSVF
jgi:hypothetical protein